MTTYTQIKEGVEPSIFTSSKHVVADINPLIYGGFTEYVYLSPLSNTIHYTHRILTEDNATGIWEDVYMAASTIPPTPMA